VVYVRVSVHNESDEKGYVAHDVPQVIVDLLDYGDLQGSISLGELTFKRKKCQSAVKGLRCGKMFAALVLAVDVKPEMGANGKRVVYVDLSKKDVSSEARRLAQINHNKAKRLTNILCDISHWVGGECDAEVTTQSLLESVAWVLHRLDPVGTPWDQLCQLVK